MEQGEQGQVWTVQLEAGTVGWAGPGFPGFAGFGLVQHISLLGINLHWGRGGLETDENILSTLQALVEGTHHLPTNNRLGTFKMLPVHGIHMGSPTPGWVHFKCVLQLSLNLTSPTTNPHISTPVQIFSLCSPTSQVIYIFWVHSKCSQNM